MIPYDVIPEQLCITHPKHRRAFEAPGGKNGPSWKKWKDEWTVQAARKKAEGWTHAEIAAELGVSAEMVRIKLAELE